MLYGKRITLEGDMTPFVTAQSERAESGYTVLPNKRLQDLPQGFIPYPEPAIVLNIQLRGAGKTKEIFDIAISDNRPILYIDLSSTPKTVGVVEIQGRTAVAREYYKSVAGIISLSSAKDRSCWATFYSERLSLCMLCLFYLWKQNTNGSYGDFLRLMIDELNSVAASIYTRLVNYTTDSIYTAIEKFLTNIQIFPMITYDEVGELLRCNQIPAVFSSRINDNNLVGYKTLFDPFADAVVRVRNRLRLYQGEGEKKKKKIILIKLTTTTIFSINRHYIKNNKINESKFIYLETRGSCLACTFTSFLFKRCSNST